MNAKKSLVALLAVLALALAVGPATVAATEGDATASASKGKKKGKSKSKSCKAGKGKKGKGKGKKNKGSKSASASAKKKGGNKKGGKKGKSRGCGKGGSAGSKLANGRYVDPGTELKFKVSGGGGKIQLEQIVFRRPCPIPLAFGNDSSVQLKTSKGQAVAKETFTHAGGSVTTLTWSVAIDPDSLRYSLEYTLVWEIPSGDPEYPPVRCDDSGSLRGKLER